MLSVACVACSGDDEATPSATAVGSPATAIASSPTSSSSLGTPGDPFPPYAGAVVGTSRTVDGAPFVTESGTGVYYSISGVPEATALGTYLFVIGVIRAVPNVHTIAATYIATIPEDGSLSCDGTLEKRDGEYFVESSAEGGCGSVELIEVDPQKLDAKVGQETTLTVKYCTVTKEGRMVKADLDPDFVCSEPYP